MTNEPTTSSPESTAVGAVPNPTPPPRSRLWDAIKRLLRTRVTAGLITVLPIYLTIIVVRFVFSVMRDASQWLVYGVLRGDWMAHLPPAWRFEWHVWTESELHSTRLQWAIAVFSVFLTIFILYGIGLFAANVFGRRILGVIERILDRLPLIKTVYRATKQILQTFTGEQTTTFQRVALVPFPNAEVLSIGFITSFCRDERTGQELCTCFLATTPNPTTGYVFILPRASVIELDWTIEEAIKVIMSGGILAPATIRYTPGKGTTLLKTPVGTSPLSPSVPYSAPGP